MNYENTHHESNNSESDTFHLPGERAFSPETDVDRSLAEGKLGSGVVHILIEKVPFEVTPIEVHHDRVVEITSVPGIERSTPVPLPGEIATESNARGKVILESHPNPRRVIGHPSNPIEQQIRNIIG